MIEAIVKDFCKHTFDEMWNSGVLLELEKGPFQHVFRIDFLDSEQVQNHVVRQMERRIERIRLTLD